MKFSDIRKSKEYKVELENLKLLSKTVKKVYFPDELKLMTSLRNKYRGIFKTKQSKVSMINSLLDTLMIGTGYYERIIDMRMGLRDIQRKLGVINKRVKVQILEISKYRNKTKHEKDDILEILLSPFMELSDTVDSYMETLEEHLSYLDKLSWSLKSAVSFLKDGEEKRQGGHKYGTS